MKNINLGLELKGLVENVSALVENISSIRGHVTRSSEDIPAAFSKLDTVNSETESATSQLMDILDNLSESDKQAGELIIKLENDLAGKEEYREIFDGLKAIIDKNQEQHIRVLETLQFQDITSQQIRHVTSLLMNVEKELSGILATFENFSRPSDHTEIDTQSFNPHAIFADKKEEQADIDDLVKKYRHEQ
ncbi:MAG: hypothetical protein A2268_09640 [Candidatus Raymondbacteria bacterium RifOxyA12_full_50_37]|uniref:Uncharacterized protein n=1 Tax=Candidatus Raymondbacteria bacterium RIFOXYD12_FULL_49_13 TaxID=1817890 RepID=A0A1F7F1T8_UNCRA|nr:MAG: hypothetical protein A2268_09640 [Candidatus Raymondbacteria bacterium RifOxyA12_full_50_37]OGJ93898.1 MAG: hypothetical protein A2248_06655 [Candidatus Raymondbacteria bacterium RIFOXYA2_FULL_49_16]OGJ98233.1 MAG: hypothetical protein A2453_00510 [Candidatus Raymondbacteria bacterium RIFOXYC2_FULL_50_21]OGK00466.1 MAG: hypothetical protein A2519_10685 [Candidatus Raymondbacteria bacterium RIFOXYD12_FULL_49_13]OGK05187.1 MAG: hypothetical protein A2487_08305 [Candidatus Raymondbacteria 